VQEEIKEREAQVNLNSEPKADNKTGVSVENGILKT
jgi:hypothetical protein